MNIDRVINHGNLILDVIKKKNDDSNLFKIYQPNL